MPAVTTCPQCQRQLRVPDEMIGTQVKCPECGTTFAATSTSQAPPGPSPDAGRYSDEPPRPSRSRPGGSDDYDRDRGRGGYDDYDRDRGPGRYDSDRGREEALSSVKAPAICLLITGILGALGDLMNLVGGIIAQGNPPQGHPGESDFERGMREGSSGPLGLVFAVLFLIAAIVVISGAIAMLRGKSYGLAVTGSVVAMLHLGCLCCLLGIPFGIWSLVVLMKPEVKEAFS